MFLLLRKRGFIRKENLTNNILILVLSLLTVFTAVLPHKAFCFDFSEEEKEWINHISSLRFSEVEWEPLSYVNDYPVYRGIVADYLDILSNETGIEMVFVQSSTWQEVLDKFAEKDIDLIPALALEDKIGSEVIFTDPYISFPLVIATRPDIDFISNTNELEGKKVGVGKGYTSYHFLKNNYPDIELVTSDNVTEGLMLLDKGKIDAFVGHMAVVMYVIKKTNLDLRIAGKTEYVFEHRIGLPPGHEKTVSIFNKVLEEITPDIHNSIYNRWIKMDVETTDYSLIWKILLSSVAVITVIFNWNRKLSADKKKFQQLFSDLNTLKNELELKNIELSKLAITDQLTGIYNRLKLDEVLQNEAARYSRSNNSFGLIIMDIDHFKKINDTYGHPAGDRILMTIAQLMQSNTRNTDIIGRWGGEEFLIICPESDEAGIGNLAEKLRKAIESHNFPEAGKYTASFGATLYRETDNIETFIKRTDEALYLAKNRGRNNVAVI